jgi:hypothetical protein
MTNDGVSSNNNLPAALTLLGAVGLLGFLLGVWNFIDGLCKGPVTRNPAS